MLLDRKLYKISENLFVNVQVISESQNIKIRMQDFKEIYAIVKNFFLEENSATKLSFNYKLDSGLNIKAYYDMSHNPLYITLNYKGGKCIDCNVLPQMLIFKILSKSPFINDLDKSCQQQNLNDEFAGSSIAQKLTSCINRASIFKNSLVKTRDGLTSIKEPDNATKERIPKSTEKLFCNYLTKTLNDSSKVISIDDKQEELNKENLSKEPCNNLSKNKKFNKPFIEENHVIYVDSESNEATNASKLSGGHSNISKNNCVERWKEGTLDMEKEHISNKESHKVAELPNQLHIKNIALGTVCLEKIEKTNFNSNINLSKDKIKDNFDITCLESETINNKRLKIKNENIVASQQLKKTKHSSGDPANEEKFQHQDKEQNPYNESNIQYACKNFIDSDVDPDFKPKVIRASKLSSRRSKRKIIDDQSIQSCTAKQSKVHKETGEINSTNTLSVKSVDVNFSCYPHSQLNNMQPDVPIENSSSVNDKSNGSNRNTFDQNPTDVIDLTADDVTPLKTRAWDSAKKLLLSRSKIKARNINKFTYKKRKSIRFNFNTPSKK